MLKQISLLEDRKKERERGQQWRTSARGRRGRGGGGLWTARSGIPERGAANVLAKLQPGGKFMLATLFRSSKGGQMDRRLYEGSRGCPRQDQAAARWH